VTTQVVSSINMMERRAKERKSSRRAFDGVKKCFLPFLFPISLIIFKARIFRLCYVGRASA
jgi:hypothetical protein